MISVWVVPASTRRELYHLPWILHFFFFFFSLFFHCFFLSFFLYFFFSFFLYFSLYFFPFFFLVFWLLAFSLALCFCTKVLFTDFVPSYLLFSLISQRFLSYCLFWCQVPPYFPHRFTWCFRLSFWQGNKRQTQKEKWKKSKSGRMQKKKKNQKQSSKWQKKKRGKKEKKRKKKKKKRKDFSKR